MKDPGLMNWIKMEALFEGSYWSKEMISENV